MVRAADDGSSSRCDGKKHAYKLKRVWKNACYGNGHLKEQNGDLTSRVLSWVMTSMHEHQVHYLRHRATLQHHAIKPKASVSQLFAALRTPRRLPPQSKGWQKKIRNLRGPNYHSSTNYDKSRVVRSNFVNPNLKWKEITNYWVASGHRMIGTKLIPNPALWWKAPVMDQGKQPGFLKIILGHGPQNHFFAGPFQNLSPKPTSNFAHFSWQHWQHLGTMGFLAPISMVSQKRTVCSVNHFSLGAY